MVKRCVVGGCSNSSLEGRYSFHTFPTNRLLRLKWDKFVKLTRKDWKTGNTGNVICGAHFRVPDDFDGHAQWKAGYKSRLDLKPGVVPSIKSISQATCSDCDLPPVKKRKQPQPLPPRSALPNTTSTTATGSISSRPAVRKLFVSRMLKDNEDEQSAAAPPLAGPNVLDEDTLDEMVPLLPEKFSIPVHPISPLPVRKRACTLLAEPDAVTNEPTSTMPYVKEKVTGTTGTQIRTRNKRRSKGITVKPQVCHVGIQCNISDAVEQGSSVQSHTCAEIVSVCGDREEGEGDYDDDDGGDDDDDDDDDDDYDNNSDESDGDEVDWQSYSDDEFVPTKPSKTFSISGDQPPPPGNVTPPYKDDTFLVFKEQLLELFAQCAKCSGPTNGDIRKRVGSLIHVHQKCHKCGHVRSWTSQPYLGKMPAGNLLLSGAILFSGCMVTQCLRLFDFMNMSCIGKSTFFRHQKYYLQPTIIKVWNDEQATMINQLSNMDGGLILAGDGRSDSPGHCAKYGSYSVIEQRLNKVLDIQLVQSNEVPNSAWCEHEGLKRTIAFLIESGLEVSTIISDRHRQNAKWIRDELPDTKHYYDVWHVAKGIGKKIDSLGSQKDCSDIKAWKQSIVNHLYWSAVSTPDDRGDLIVAKWCSLVGHVQNVHTNHPDPLFPDCAHGPLEGENRNKLWIQPNSRAAVKLESLLTSKALLKDISKLSPDHQTSTLEAFHSLLLHFAPKHTSFSNLGMQSRQILAGLHYNENNDRPHAVNEEGQFQYTIVFPKYKKGGYIVRAVKTKATYMYVEKLMKTLFDDYGASPRNMKRLSEQMRENIPGPLSASMVHPDKEDAINLFMSRFNTQV
ncbi:uncharacterized protein [Ptychodera flava]|uniref:uncharacterized protein isoform X2 n=1 Tax=Ptychodera flava TaxID=63121 RepID=UPI00396A6C5C